LKKCIASLSQGNKFKEITATWSVLPVLTKSCSSKGNEQYIFGQTQDLLLIYSLLEGEITDSPHKIDTNCQCNEIAVYHP
jgi:hypothetical protein